MQHELGIIVDLEPNLLPYHFHGHRPCNRRSWKNSAFGPTNRLDHRANLIHQSILLLYRENHLEVLVRQTVTFQALVSDTCNGLGADVDKQESCRNGHQDLVQEIPCAYDYESHVTDVHPIIHEELVIDWSPRNAVPCTTKHADCFGGISKLNKFLRAVDIFRTSDIEYPVSIKKSNATMRGDASGKGAGVYWTTHPRMVLPHGRR